MRSKIAALALFAVTAATVAYYPAATEQGTAATVDSPRNEQPRIEVAFVLDTTGSMGGLIQAAKEKIWSIATSMASAQSAPEISMGLVAYRDRGDDYVTQVTDLSTDLDSMYATLMDLRAAGGGDGPESVNQALDDAVQRLSWSQDPQVYKVVFLVGDAPPHMDYRDDVKYPKSLATADRQGIVVNAIQCGRNGRTTHAWQQIAQRGHGRYFQVDQAGGAVAIGTPFDAKIARLSAKMDATRLYYGTAEEKEKQQRKLDAARKLRAKSSAEALARRAAFNTSASGKSNFLGDGELVDDLASGRVDLSSIDREKLPAPMQPLSADEQQALIHETAERRDRLQRQIQTLTSERAEFLHKRVEAAGGAAGSLDDQIYSAVRAQGAKKGLRYEAAAPAY